MSADLRVQRDDFWATMHQGNSNKPSGPAAALTHRGKKSGPQPLGQKPAAHLHTMEYLNSRSWMYSFFISLGLFAALYYAIPYDPQSRSGDQLWETIFTFPSWMVPGSAREVPAAELGAQHSVPVIVAQTPGFIETNAFRFFEEWPWKPLPAGKQPSAVPEMDLETFWKQWLDLLQTRLAVDAQRSLEVVSKGQLGGRSTGSHMLTLAEFLQAAKVVTPDRVLVRFASRTNDEDGKKQKAYQFINYPQQQKLPPHLRREHVHYYGEVPDRLAPHLQGLMASVSGDGSTSHTAQRLLIAESSIIHGLQTRKARTWFTQVSGRTRWKVFPHEDAVNLYMYPSSHEYAGLSQINLLYSKVLNDFPNARFARGYDIVLHTGQTLYIPPYWVVSLTHDVARGHVSTLLESTLPSAEAEQCGKLGKIALPVDSGWSFEQRGAVTLKLIERLVRGFYDKFDIEKPPAGKERSVPPLIHFARAVLSTRYQRLLQNLLRQSSDEMRAHITKDGCSFANQPEATAVVDDAELDRVVQEVTTTLTPLVGSEHPLQSLGSTCLGDYLETLSTRAVGNRNSGAFIQFCFASMLRT